MPSRCDGTARFSALSVSLSPDALKDLDDYTYTDQLNDFLQDRNDKLILMDPVGSC